MKCACDNKNCESSINVEVPEDSRTVRIVTRMEQVMKPTSTIIYADIPAIDELIAELQAAKVVLQKSRDTK